MAAGLMSRPCSESREKVGKGRSAKTPLADSKKDTKQETTHLDVVRLGADDDDGERLAALAAVGLDDGVVPVLHGGVAALVGEVKEDDRGVGGAEEAVVGQTALGVQVGVEQIERHLARRGLERHGILGGLESLDLLLIRLGRLDARGKRGLARTELAGKNHLELFGSCHFCVV
ncbi:hypothetical protein L1887_58048 [Cichorium endivia]|nr:hypothetical protein L1887_58048 [Cichorium endivia]